MKNQVKRTALITGSSGGIGSAVARDLASKNYHLILMDINEQDNRKLADELPSAEIITLDLTNRDELRAICKLIPQYELDVAFINAGMVYPGDVIDLDEKMIDLQIEINLRSTIMINRACGDAMSSRGRGSIINTVSAGGIVGMKSSAIYSAAKFGLRGFLMSFHSEMKKNGVSVSGLYPAAVDTKMLEKETLNGGSVLNFLNTPSTVQDLVKGFNKAIKTGKLEIHIPQSGSILSKILGGVFPGMIDSLYPILQRIGEKGKAKYLRKLDSKGVLISN
ncbi:MAG: short-subunit dehydrogenase [Cyclobacteriaceae bacterium]|jgi:short-subunit dehydrogenase